MEERIRLQSIPRFEENKGEVEKRKRKEGPKIGKKAKRTGGKTEEGRNERENNIQGNDEATNE